MRSLVCVAGPSDARTFLVRDAQEVVDAPDPPVNGVFLNRSTRYTVRRIHRHSGPPLEYLAPERVRDEDAIQHLLMRYPLSKGR